MDGNWILTTIECCKSLNKSIRPRNDKIIVLKIQDGKSGCPTLTGSAVKYSKNSSSGALLPSHWSSTLNFNPAESRL